MISERPNTPPMLPPITPSRGSSKHYQNVMVRKMKAHIGHSVELNRSKITEVSLQNSIVNP